MECKVGFHAGHTGCPLNWLMRGGKRNIVLPDYLHQWQISCNWTKKNKNIVRGLIFVSISHCQVWSVKVTIITATTVTGKMKK